MAKRSSSSATLPDSSTYDDSVPVKDRFPGKPKNKKPRFEGEQDCLHLLGDAILRLKIKKEMQDAVVTDDVSRWIALAFNRLTDAFLLGTSVTRAGLIDAVTAYSSPTVDTPTELQIYPESRLALFDLLSHTTKTGTLLFLDNAKEGIGADQFVDSLDLFAYGNPVSAQNPSEDVSHARLVGTSYQPTKVAEVAIVCVILIEMLSHEGHNFSPDGANTSDF